MSLLSAIALGLAMGIIFGIALEKSRVFEPGVIVGQMQLRNFIMLKVFLTAVATSALAIAAMQGAGLVTLQPKPFALGPDIAGGMILGAGIALAGACPGTVLAQIGAGYRDALAVLAGGLAGAIGFSYAQPRLAGTWLAAGKEKLLLTEMMGVPFWQGALALVVLLVVILYALENWRPWRTELGRDLDGDTGRTGTPGSTGAAAEAGTALGRGGAG